MHKLNRRRILIAQLNTYRRLAGLREMTFFAMSNQALSVIVNRLHNSDDLKAEFDKLGAHCGPSSTKAA